MAKIFFEFTINGNHASQGDTASGTAGYNMWMGYPDNEVYDFLGFCTEEDAPYKARYYIDNGDDVKVGNSR